jgi:protein-disulfide isomerase
MAEHTYRAQVREDFRSGIEDGVNGTPTIFINRVRYDGRPEFATLSEVVDRIVTS